VDDWITTAERLLATPFPDRMTRHAGGFAEPGLHVADLMVSQDFWNEDDDEAMESTRLAYEARSARLVEALTARWGEPAQVDLSAALDRSLRGEALPPLTGYLCNVAGGPAPLWRRGDRHVSVVVAWSDQELPMTLTLAVGVN
jgi:hypothetical protein